MIRLWPTDGTVKERYCALAGLIWMVGTVMMVVGLFNHHLMGCLVIGAACYETGNVLQAFADQGALTSARLSARLAWSNLFLSTALPVFLGLVGTGAPILVAGVVGLAVLLAGILDYRLNTHGRY